MLYSDYLLLLSAVTAPAKTATIQLKIANDMRKWNFCTHKTEKKNLDNEILCVCKQWNGGERKVIHAQMEKCAEYIGGNRDMCVYMRHPNALH